MWDYFPSLTLLFSFLFLSWCLISHFIIFFAFDLVGFACQYPNNVSFPVCGRLTGYMKTGKFMTGSVLKVSLIILHNAYWRWKLSLRISSSSWMGNTSNKSEAPSGNLRRSNGSCLILKHQLAIGLSFSWLLSRSPSSCAWHVVYPPEKT